MENINLKNNLLKIGFSEHDAEVYLALIKKSPCTAGPIITATKFHRNVVYTSFSHLISRKLVSESEKSGKKLFSLTSPQFLIEDYKNKVDLVKETVKEISNLLPKEKQEITIHEGNEEYLALLTGIIKSMPRGSVKYVLGTGGEKFMEYTMRLIWKKYHKVANVQGVNIKMLSYESQRCSIEPDISNETIYDIRYLPDNIENPAGVHIYPAVNTILNIIYSDEKTPVTAIKIKNSALTQGYLNLFNNLWKIARK